MFREEIYRFVTKILRISFQFVVVTCITNFIQIVIKLFKIININEEYFRILRYLFHCLSRKINSVNVEIHNR